MAEPNEGRELTEEEKREITRDLLDAFLDSTRGTDEQG